MFVGDYIVYVGRCGPLYRSWIVCLLVCVGGSILGYECACECSVRMVVRSSLPYMGDSPGYRPGVVGRSFLPYKKEYIN